jgi:hypothetical protein
MTQPKEPNFFSDDDNYHKGIEWYQTLFAGAKEAQLKGESSTHYTKFPIYPRTVERLVEYNPNIKFIYIMRHPVDRLISHYIHEWTQGIISCDIDKAVVRFTELVDYGRYNMQIEQYLTRFSPSSILPLFAERLNIDPQAELKRVFDFLNIPEQAIWHENIRSNVSSERLRVCGWRDKLVHNSLLTSIRRKFVPKKVRRKIRQFWTMRERPELSIERLNEIKNVFDEDLYKLGLKLSLPISCDTYKQQIINSDPIEWDYKAINH